MFNAVVVRLIDMFVFSRKLFLNVSIKFQASDEQKFHGKWRHRPQHQLERSREAKSGR